MKRRFSCREISLIDQMIQTIGRDLFLPERLEDDARSIGWCTFLHTYQKYPAQFLWAGVGGWARAYLEIQTELRAFQVQETSRYYTLSVDQPLTTESKAPLLSVFVRSMRIFARISVCGIICSDCRRMKNGWQVRSAAAIRWRRSRFSSAARRRN